MTSEKDLREQLATCTRIFAMQGMIGVFGHVSVYQPETKRVLITPGMGSDKGSLRPEDMVPTDLDGKPLEGKNGPPVEWPIHTALHSARADALAVAHLHTPTQLFSPSPNGNFALSLCKARSSAMAFRCTRRLS